MFHSEAVQSEDRVSETNAKKLLWEELSTARTITRDICR